MPLSDRDQEIRRGRMTATRIVKVAGLSPYGNAHDVFAEMVEGKVFAGNEATRRGERVEPVIRDWAAERLGVKFRVPGTIVHPKHERICATVDGIEDPEESLILECKSLDFARLDECGPDGSDEIPQDWVAQTQVQMGCLGIPRATVAVMFGVSELRLYPVAFDPEYFGILAEIAERFLRDHVDPKRPPPVDASESCAEALRARFPVDRGPVIQADDYLESVFRDYWHLRRRREQDEEREQEARNRLLERIGDAAGVTGRDWKISYRRNKDGTKTDWEALAKAYTPTPAEIAKFTTTKPGPRVFRVTGPKKED